MHRSRYFIALCALLPLLASCGSGVRPSGQSNDPSPDAQVRHFCIAGELDTCGDGKHCATRCVPSHDPCDGVTCTRQQTCIDGQCVDGCFARPCNGLICAAGTFCDRSLNACVQIHRCDVQCQDGFVCHEDCVPDNPCSNVRCEANQYCANGRCVDDPCANVDCAQGTQCVNGRCENTCECTRDCVPGSLCADRLCTCEPACNAQSKCGDDDGCLGKCMGSCEGDQDRCSSITHECECQPYCPGTVPCGGDDGCGGQCVTGCPSGQYCDVSVPECKCAPQCPQAFLFECDETIANNCPGEPDCGYGTHCDDVLDTCNPITHRCECNDECPSANDYLCGETIRRPCTGATCGTGTRCAGAGVCVDGDCCTPSCPSSLACNAHQSDGCGGTCVGTACAPGEECTPSGCRCASTCNEYSACGSSNGCGGECSGTCLPGEICARNPLNINDYGCVPQAECTPACDCTSVCVSGSCVPRCTAPQTTCGCSCCNADEVCESGECRAISID